MARSQLLSMILARQHQKVANPWVRQQQNKPVVVRPKYHFIISWPS